MGDNNLTSCPDQAKRWAIRMKLIRNVEDAFLNVYEFDSDSVLEAGYRHLFLKRVIESLIR